MPAPSKRELQTVDKKLFSPPEGGRIALSANERIAEFLDFAIQAKFAYVNKLTHDARTALGKEENSVEKRRINRFCEAAALAACYRSCLELAREHRIDSVDFPSISTGVYGYPMAQAASVALKAIMEDLRTHDHPCRVRMVCHTEDAANIYRQTYNLWYAETKEDRL